MIFGVVVAAVPEGIKVFSDSLFVDPFFFLNLSSFLDCELYQPILHGEMNYYSIRREVPKSRNHGILVVLNHLIIGG